MVYRNAGGFQKRMSSGFSLGRNCPKKKKKNDLGKSGIGNLGYLRQCFEACSEVFRAAERRDKENERDKASLSDTPGSLMGLW